MQASLDALKAKAEALQRNLDEVQREMSAIQSILGDSPSESRVKCLLTEAHLLYVGICMYPSTGRPQLQHCHPSSQTIWTDGAGAAVEATQHEHLRGHGGSKHSAYSNSEECNEHKMNFRLCFPADHASAAVDTLQHEHLRGRDGSKRSGDPGGLSIPRRRRPAAEAAKRLRWVAKLQVRWSILSIVWIVNSNHRAAAAAPPPRPPSAALGRQAAGDVVHLTSKL